jgi:hypothetical protein
MKIGFSLGRCVRDIVNGLVKIDDVGWIIASTNIQSEEQLQLVIQSYSYEPKYLGGLVEDDCQQVALTLYNSGRILQPRMQGVRRTMVPEDSIWADLYPTVNSERETVKQAWHNYRFMLHMTEQLPEDAEIHWR